MKRFVWRLQQVLDIKAKEEETRRTELFELTQTLAQTRGRLLRQQSILRDIISRIARQKGQKRLGPQAFFLKYSAADNEWIKELKHRILELESQQREKIAQLLKVKRFKEGLERLRAEAKIRFIKEQERLEQKELDEGATVSFARKQRLEPASRESDHVVQ